jgi:hypothetical protein
MFSPITRGDLMDSKTREYGMFQWMGRGVGSASLLLLISAGIELFVQGTLGHSSVATVNLDRFLAFWSFVLGLGLLFFLSLERLTRWRHVRVTRAAMSNSLPAESRSWGLEKPEQEARQHLEHEVATGVPIRSTRAGENENEKDSLTRAA